MDTTKRTSAAWRAGVRNTRYGKHVWTAAFLLLALAGCAGPEPEGQARVGEPQVEESQPAPEVEAPAPQTGAGVLDWDDLPALEPDGFGPIRVGMTPAEASAAVGSELAQPEGMEASCFYVFPEDAPQGLGLMFSEGRLARIDVTTDAYETAAGGQVGQSTEEVEDLYDGALAVSPHKYDEGGTYLTLTPSGELATTHRLIFETHDGEVTSFRAGQLPQVEWVEGCS